MKLFVLIPVIEKNKDIMACHSTKLPRSCFHSVHKKDLAGS